jgi:hypothetical protein
MTAVGAREPVSLDTDREMNRVVLRLLLVQHGNTSNFSGTSAGHASSKPPTGEAHPIVEQLVEEYRRALSETDKRRVLRRAKAEVAALHRPHTTVEDVKSLDEVVIEDGVGFDPRMVAQRFGLSEHHVRRIRQRAGRIADDGTKPPDEDLTREDRLREARRMKNNGMSTRQIAFALHVSQALVVKDLKAAA